jgi:transcriptional regulator with XRE-family HTH domain
MEKITAGDYTPRTFREIYKSLPKLQKAPKAAFIEEIASLCMCSEQTVRMWIQGVQKPDALKQSRISEKLGLNTDVLFPV